MKVVAHEEQPFFAYQESTFMDEVTTTSQQHLDNVYQLDQYRRQRVLRYLERGEGKKKPLRLVQHKREGAGRDAKILNFPSPEQRLLS